jgi:hypothetical protein
VLNKTNEEILNSLCDKYGSDKGSNFSYSDVYGHVPHNYTKIYSALFSSLRDEELTIFECGLGTNNVNYKSSMGPNGMPGASLRVWRDFFPNSKVFGVDIDKDVIFSEDRIVTDYMDQTSPESIRDFWDKHNIRPNIIIDDGLHEYDAGRCLYENSIDHLEKNGIYIIEDVVPEDLIRYKEYFQNNVYQTMFISINRKNLYLYDNTLVVIFKD